MAKLRTTNKKQLAARVLCGLLLSTYLTGAYSLPVAWGAPAGDGATIQGIGVSASVTADAASAWGSGTTADGDYSTAFGFGTKAKSEGSTAWGYYTIAGDGTADTEYSTAWGFRTNAIGYDATAWGDSTTASNEEATAWGVGTTASGRRSTAWGYETKAIGDYATTWGSATTAEGKRSTAWGHETTAEGENATAWGVSTKATGKNSTAFGSVTTASGHTSTAWGFQTQATNRRATAWGEYSVASAVGATAWGLGTEDSRIIAGGESATAFGKNSRAYGDNSLAALGGRTGEGSIMIIPATGQVVVNRTPGKGDGAVAVGEGAVAETSYTYAIGQNATIVGYDKDNAIAIGNGTSVTVAGGVALGSEAVASVDAGEAGYDPSTGAASTDSSGVWKSTRAALSIGTADGTVTRQITGVAAGSKDTDAVNVAQLKKVAEGAVYTAGKGVSIADNEISVKADTKDFAFDSSGTLTLKKDGKVESGNTGVVTGGTVYEALQSQSAAIDGKANKSLDNITDSGKTVVRDLAKEAVKVVDGTNTTVTDGTDGNAKTYAVNVVTNGTIASGDTGIVTGGTVFTETRVSADGNYIKAADSTADNLTALDTQVKKNEDAIGTTADGNYVKASNSVGENLGALDAEIAALAGGAGAGIDELSHRISNVDSKVEKVGAGAAALAALHPMDTDGKFSAAAGFGNYRSANAMALGLFYRPNDQVLFSMGGSMGNGENLLNVGVSFALDKGVSTSKAAMARKIVSLTEENAQQAAKIETLEARLAALEAKLGK